MVWIPAIAEYIYLLICEHFASSSRSSRLTASDGIQEGSEYRFMAPLTVTAQQPTPATNVDPVQQPTPTANTDPVQPQEQPENVSRASSAEHGHSGSQGNESAMLPTTWSTSNIEIDINTLWDDIERVGQD